MAMKAFREAVYDRAKADPEKRTIPIAFSSETPVRCYGRMLDDSEEPEEFDEVLDHSEGCIDMSRAKEGLPLMLSHKDWDAESQVGIVEGIEIRQDKKGVGTARFGAGELADNIFADVKNEIRKGVSVGYERTSIVSTAMENGRKVVRFRWSPLSVSVVPVPADLASGFGRNKDNARNQSHTMGDENKDKTPTGLTPEQVTVRENDAVTRERNRITEINASVEALCEKHPDGADKFRSMGRDALAKGTTAEAFKGELLVAIPGTRKANPITTATLGMSQRDVKRYSIMRAVQNLINRRSVDGLEKEVHDEMCKRNIGFQPEGFWVPTDIMQEQRMARDLQRSQQRDLQVTNFNQGGAFVQTTILTPIIELLRNRMVTDRLGVQTLSGLEGNVAIPRQTGAATAYAVTELATLTKSTQAIDQILLNPKRIGAYNDYSKQLLLQSSVDVENFMRDDLMKVLAIKHDYIILQGQGANNEPLGIMNTVGIGSVAFGNAAATWAKMLEFETSLSVANADAGNMAYITTPGVRAKLKAAAKIGTTFPIFIWEPGKWADGSNDGEVNGYRAAVTNQVLDNRVAFGNWEDAVLAIWGGFDVVVNPFTRDIDGAVRISVNTFCDVAVRHAASFAWSSDPGNV